MAELMMPTSESWWKSFSQKLLKSNSLVFTYLRSIVSSQAASWTDMLTAFVLFSLAGLDAFYATAIGAICGGILNCIINYRFTFRADGCDWRAVMVKYVVVWVGSMLLNAYGTDGVYNMLDSWTWLHNLGFNSDGIFAAARLSTSLIVSWFWNFALQRYFVYRSIGIDKYIIRIAAALHIGKKA